MASPGERALRAARFRADRARARALDVIDKRLGRRPELTPPRALQGDDYGEFERIGSEFLGYFTELGGLRPGDAVLDIGCGVGRMAVPLTTYLDEGGRYEGFDIVRPEVEWCQAEITPRFPSFTFQHAAVRNARYNPGGAWDAAKYTFPYDDHTFDFAFATSVFTHMLAPDSERYLQQTARVLKPGGRLLATWFLLNLESRARIADADSHFTFRVPSGDCFAEDEDSIEAAVAYEEKKLGETLERVGLEVVEKRYGDWSGRPDGMTWQDVLVMRAA
jgi:SAM-dependent methyltransferase